MSDDQPLTYGDYVRLRQRVFSLITALKRQRDRLLDGTHTQMVPATIKLFETEITKAEQQLAFLNQRWDAQPKGTPQ